MKIITKQIKYILYGHRIYFSSQYSWFGFAFVSIKSPCNVLFFVMVVLVSVSDDNCWSSWGSVLGVAGEDGIDSQGVFGGSWLGLPGLQCTITPPHHHHQYHQCHTTTSDVVWCWCVGGPPPHHITPPPPPPPTSLHHQYHQHQTTSIDATIPPPTSDLHLYRMKTTRNTSSPKDKSMDVFGLGCIGL